MSDGRSVSNVRSNALARRIAITIGALLVFRLGGYLPVPGVDQDELSRLLQATYGGTFGFLVSGVSLTTVIGAV